MANSILSKMGALRLSPPTIYAQTRTTTSKHWNPKFKKLRAQKFVKVELPNFNEDISKLSTEKIRQKMKERGLMPARPWMERPFFISATANVKQCVPEGTEPSGQNVENLIKGGVFEPYVPPEGDGKASLVSTTRAKQTVQLLEKKSKSMMAIRKVKSFDEEFDTKEFCSLAQDIYIKAHDSLAANDRHKLREYVTEKAYSEFRHNTRLKTIRWKFLESLEPPRVVHARCTDVISKENIFGQITVRFHTRQQLSVYDRFGRLLHGSEILAKDVLEYIVFEKHLSNLYGVWRIHGKIIPDWAPPKDPSKLTRIMPKPEPDIAATAQLEKGEEVPAIEAK